MLQSQPIKTYRGTWDELMSHRNEIAPDAMLEIRVYEPERQETATMTLMRSWLEEDATDDLAEHEAATQELNEFKRNMNQMRREAGARLLYPEVE